MAEKKIVSLPSIRVEEGMRDDLRGLAEVMGVTESALQRMAISKLLDEELAKYQALHTIFAGRDRRSNKSCAMQCDEHHDGEME